MVNMDKHFYSTIEAAKILGISRIAVFKKIKSGDLKAEKIGRNYAIAQSDLLSYMGSGLSDDQRREIEKAVQNAIQEYRKAFELLGKE